MEEPEPTLTQGLDTCDRAASYGPETFGKIFLSPLRKLSEDKVLSASRAPDARQGLGGQAPVSPSLLPAALVWA